ncbi:hypothetical protein Tco_0245361 [Tanacetum coccineum]
MAGEDENHDENANIPPPVPPTQQAPHTLLTFKLPILKKGSQKKGNGPVQVSTVTNRQISVLPPKTAEEILARERERKARTTLLMSIPEDHLTKFHKMTDAKEMWEAIKSRFGGNDESKKMQKYILKQQFESFSAYPLKMPIRSSLGLYLLPGPNTSSTNDVSTAYGVSTSSVHNSQREGSSSYTDELMYSFFANQSVAMISMRLKKFYKKTGKKLQFDAKEPVRFDKTKVEFFNCHNTGYFSRECRSKGNQESRRRDQENFALMAYNNLGSDTEVTSCSKECDESYAKLKKLYDEQREQLGDASIDARYRNSRPILDALKKG